MGQITALKIGLAAIVAIAIAGFSAWHILSPTDEEAWHQASTTNTLEAYERYVSERSAGAFVGEAKAKIADFQDERDWREAVEHDTFGSYQHYIKRHTSDRPGKYVKQARERQDILFAAALWRQAKKEGTREAFAKYAKVWPNGANIAEAKARLHDFDLRSRFRRALQSGTIRSLQSLILSHPDAPEAEAAGERVAALKQDDKPFLAARKRGTAKAFENFLRDYPGHVRTADAERDLKDLRGIDIFALVADKRVSISIKGGGLTDARVTLTNTDDRAVSVVIPSAVMFASRNPKIQNMVTTAGTLVTLRPKQTKSLVVPVACANMPRKAPDASTELFLEQVANRPALQRVVQHMQKIVVPFPVRQAAVWVVTDDATYKGLSILSTMRVDHAVRALRVLVESGIDLRQYEIWQGAVGLLKDYHIRALMDWQPPEERNAIWMFELLDRQGDARIRALLKDGMLNLAAAAGWTGMIQILVNKGHDVNQRDEGHQTPLHDLMQRSRYNSVSNLKPAIDALVGAGADVNATDDYGRTPILFANAGPGFEALVAAGADLGVVDNGGSTLLHEIRLDSDNASNTLDVLIRAGLDINHADNQGNTPLHQAVHTGDKQKIQGLIRLGAISTPNEAGELPIDVLQLKTQRQEFEKLLNGQ